MTARSQSIKVEWHKGKQLEEILLEYKDQENKGNVADKTDCGTINKIPSNAKTIILILGMMLLADGSPQPQMIKRCKFGVKLLKRKQLDLNTTYFIVSGSDVSNSRFRYDTNYRNQCTNMPHKTEASVMKNILITKYNISSKNIILESKAHTTKENMYYFFKLLYYSNIAVLSNCYIVTCDYHVERCKFNFDIMYRFEKEIINNDRNDDHMHDNTIENKDESNYNSNSNVITRKYEIHKWFECENIQFIGTDSQATKDTYENETRLLNSKFLKMQAQLYRDYIWNEIKNINSNINNIGINRRNSLDLYANSSAIEHMYLRLNNAKQYGHVAQIGDGDITSQLDLENDHQSQSGDCTSNGVICVVL